MNSGTKNPNRLVDPMGNGGDEKRLGWLSNGEELTGHCSLSIARSLRAMARSPQQSPEALSAPISARLAVAEKQWKFKVARHKAVGISFLLVAVGREKVAASWLSAAVLAVEFNRNV